MDRLRYLRFCLCWDFSCRLGLYPGFRVVCLCQSVTCSLRYTPIRKLTKCSSSCRLNSYSINPHWCWFCPLWTRALTDSGIWEALYWREGTEWGGSLLLEWWAASDWVTWSHHSWVTWNTRWWGNAPRYWHGLRVDSGGHRGCSWNAYHVRVRWPDSLSRGIVPSLPPHLQAVSSPGIKYPQL